MFSQNEISIENALPGTPKSQWDINGAGDLSIQGFATQISVNKGDTVYFKINTDANAYTIDIYRMGYYQGLGAALKDTATITATLPQNQPTDLYDPVTGKTDCSNWDTSAYWLVPANAVSGIYIAKLTRTDNNGASHILFVVRDDNGNSDLLFKTSDATWQAYNGYGGNSLYVDGNGIPNYVHATKVSYQRPFYSRSGGGGGGAEEDWFFNAAYPMIRWLERNGYDVSYTTDLDMDRDTTPITPSRHKVLLSVGHDEYWSLKERSLWENARNAGVHLAFFSGNEVYWKTRWEDNHQTLVCYKEGTTGENTCGTKCDTSTNEWTGNWRDGCDFTPPSDGCRPENALTGQLSWAENTTSITVPSDFSDYWFWENTSVASLSANQTATMTNGTIGYEWDFEQSAYAEHYPNGRILLSETNIGGKVHKLSLYKHASGAWVFGAGTVQWSWGLDSVHDRGNNPPSSDIQQATVNLFVNMGVVPDSLQGDLVLTTPTSDTIPPIVSISTPLVGDTANLFSSVTISGNASDTQTVAGVEVSFNNGVSWVRTEGTTSWSYNWNPTNTGNTIIKARSFDDSGNFSDFDSVEVYVDTATLNCPCSIFNNAQTPGNGVENDGQGLTVGMKFRTSIDGYITGLKFYKDVANTGTHTGILWSGAGNNLSQAVFTNETASGWQSVSLSSPVFVDSGTTFVTSYHSANGNYSTTNSYFLNSFTNGYLTALANGEDGSNGVYSYGSSPGFPNQTFQSSNYWVDVIFELTAPPDTLSPTIVTTSPDNNQTGVSILPSILITLSELLDSATVNGNTVILQDSSGGTVGVQISYSKTNNQISILPNDSLNNLETYRVTLKGSGPNVLKDTAGNILSGDYTFQFTTVTAQQVDFFVGAGGPILIVGDSSNPNSFYASEILRTEGLNTFYVLNIGEVNANVLSNYDVVILGEVPLSAPQVTMLTNFVTDSGGTLIAFKPDNQLASLLGITVNSGNLGEGYFKIDTTNDFGSGIVGQSIQYHDTAKLFTLNGASSLANLFSDASTDAGYHAVSINEVGSNGGKAIAFAFDVAKSVIFTRQGNLAWNKQERDGEAGPRRGNDLFFGNAAADPQNDWVDFDKIHIPQADELQRFLANIIIRSNLDKMPLPRLWYFPRKLKAVVVMTGDDHANGGTIARFNQYISLSSSNTQAAVEDWYAIRGSSYIYANTPITNAQIVAFQNQGFEIGLHVNTGCVSYTEASLENDWNTQWATFVSNFPDVNNQVSHRTHCIAFSDWDSQPRVQAARGVRMDVNYYYWPGSWVQDRPGMFTGSGMPMRFADTTGNIIDCYQVTTQLTDESSITYTSHINTLLDNAIGNKGYYGAFCANMHTDANTSAGSDDIITSAQARDIPVIATKQLLDWVDGKTNTVISDLSFSNNILSFSIEAAAGSKNMYAMLPFEKDSFEITSITYNGNPVSYEVEEIKGINYAFFDATLGNANYQAFYSLDTIPPIISNVVVSPSNSGNSATISWNTNEFANQKIIYGLDSTSISAGDSSALLNTFHTINLNGLSNSSTYYYKLFSTDSLSNQQVYPLSGFASFMTPAPSSTCFIDDSTNHFSQGTLLSTIITNNVDGEVELSPSTYEGFDSLTTPTGWTDAIWDAQPSANTTYNGGSVDLNGTHIYTTASFSPGTILEFKATFTSGDFQNIGFTNDAAFNSPWVVIGRGAGAGSNVYARTSDNQSVSLGTNLLNTEHTYRIKWNSGSNNFSFYVDDSLMSTTGITTTVAGNMIVQLSDYPSGGVSLNVSEVKILPYDTLGTFTSRVYNAGSTKTWGNLSYDASTSGNTSITVKVRTGNTSSPDGSWTNFTTVSNGANIGQTSQYIQYQAILSTSATDETPILNSVEIDCANPSDTLPYIVQHPVDATLCDGDSTNFIASASGYPSPTIQWQKSTNGGSSWSSVIGETTNTLRIEIALANDNDLYRALFNNSEGSAASDSARLSVNAGFSGSISSNATICYGDSIKLVLDSATSEAPYELTISGKVYSDVEKNDEFASISTEITSIWEDTGTPDSPNASDGQVIEVGVKFRSSINGFIYGIRFYKGISNTGTHIGTLWNTSGTSLATDTFKNETASGWQEMYFDSPIAINSNTTYIASYLSQEYFAITANFFTSAGVTNGYLTALQAGIDGVNGVYLYGGGFPNNGNTANYWVDVLFSEIDTSASNDFVFSNVTSNSGCTNASSPINTVSVDVKPAPIGTLTSVLTCESDSAQIKFDASVGASPFSLTINGVNYSNVTSGSTFKIDTSTINTEQFVWNASDTGGNLPSPDNGDVELGVKFRSNVDGYISGVRFFKKKSNTGIHTGSLWNSSGILLATDTFTNETNTGWQEVKFSNPVRIAANTTYIASYHAPNGNYAFNGSFFSAAGVTNGYLTALQNGTDGGNGVYTYASGTIFPSSSFNASNYWVDVVFYPETYKEIELTKIVDNNGCILESSPIDTVYSKILSESENYLTDSVSIHCDTGVFETRYPNIFGCDSIVTTRKFLETGGDNVSICTPPLPINLISFYAECKNDFFILHWETLAEFGCDYFKILGSIDGVDFEELITLTGRGYYNGISAYQFADLNSKVPFLYFKLVTVDFDGKESIESTIYKNCDDSKPEIKIVPNPNHGNFSIFGLPAEYNLFIYDALGNEVIKVLKSKAQSELKLGGFSSGIYYVVVFNDFEMVTKKIMINSN